MAFDRQGTGLAIARVCLGVFFLSHGVSKYRWFLDASLLEERLRDWRQAAESGSLSSWYLDRIALPGLEVFARAVPLGEIASGVALLVGWWTPFFAFVAFFMTMNFAVASGVIFRLSYLTNGYGLPVLGSTLSLALGGVRLPWSVR
jgi:uncharacterized membrane protein YphA (DoxX/SURF4 family)